MRVTDDRRSGGQYAQIPIKVIYRDKRDAALRYEQEDIIQVFITQSDIDTMKREEQAGHRSFQESLRNDLQYVVEDMLKEHLSRFPDGYIEVVINGVVKWL